MLLKSAHKIRNCFKRILKMQVLHRKTGVSTFSQKSIYKESNSKPIEQNNILENTTDTFYPQTTLFDEMQALTKSIVYHATCENKLREQTYRFIICRWMTCLDKVLGQKLLESPHVSLCSQNVKTEWGHGKSANWSTQKNSIPKSLVIT